MLQDTWIENPLYPVCSSVDMYKLLHIIIPTQPFTVLYTRKPGLGGGSDKNYECDGQSSVIQAVKISHT